MKALVVKNNKVPIRYKRSSRAKHVSMSVGIDLILTVTLPLRVSERTAHSFIREKSDWIVRSYNKMTEKFQSRQSINIQDGGKILYLGKWYAICVFTGNPGVRIVDDRMEVFLASGKNDVNVLRSEVERFLRSEARDILSRCVQYYSEKNGFYYGKVSFKDQKTRWGSCSTGGNLNFNFRLVMASPQVIAYIVVHELCHLLEMNHSKRFWSHVERVMPDYKQYDVWLKQHGFLLHLL